MLARESEVRIIDGTTIRFCSGHIPLAEGVDDQGYTSRVVGVTDRIPLFLPLADQEISSPQVATQELKERLL